MKHLKSYYLLTLLFLGSFNWSAAQIRTQKCGTQIMHQTKMQTDPNYRATYQSFERAVQNALRTENMSSRANCATPAFFPVAIHYDWTPSAADQAKLITLAQNQIATLNTSFNGGDCQGGTNNNCFEFFLATHNHPTGSGLTEGQPAVTFGGTANMDYCPTINGNTEPCNLSNWVGYMNITVNDLVNAGNECSDLGVSHLPGNPTTANSMSVNSCAFGSSGVISGVPQVLGGANCACLATSVNLGTTTVHEIGHFLGLYHTFCEDNPDAGAAGSNPMGSIPNDCTTTQCDCDEVTDTPPQAYSNIGCPGGSAAGTLPNPSNGNSQHAFSNFMDYVDDACMDCFSMGQYQRVAATIASAAAGVANYKSKATVTGGGTSNCVANLTLTNNPLSGTHVASATIQTSGTVNVNNTATLKAGTSVTLNPGFWATAGSTFTAIIEACVSSLSEEPIELEKRIVQTSGIDKILPTDKSITALNVMPNPARAATNVLFQVKENIEVSIYIYNGQGQLVELLVDQERISAGTHQVVFHNSQQKTGVHFLVMKTAKEVLTRKIILLK